MHWTFGFAVSVLGLCLFGAYLYALAASEQFRYELLKALALAPSAARGLGYVGGVLSFLGLSVYLFVIGLRVMVDGARRPS